MAIMVSCTPAMPLHAVQYTVPPQFPEISHHTGKVEPKNLTVLAAASLTESFTELGKLFETQNPGVTIIFNFAGSQQLAQQLGEGADADVFASASKKYMDATVESKRVKTDDATTFVKNRWWSSSPKITRQV